MAQNREVIEALEDALAETGSTALRLHLADLYLEDELPQRALEHVEHVLRVEPDNSAALALGGQAAAASGDHDRAGAYRRLVAAVGENGSSAPDEPKGSVALPTELKSEQTEHMAPVGRLRVLKGDGEAPVDGVEQPLVMLDDVGGLADIKRRLELSFLGPMRNPALRSMYGKSLRGGLLLYGPPGCGKTYLARALAGELGAGFLAVGLHEILDMWLGTSERNLHAVFETARRHAPCVLFLDELDALGMKRSNLSHSAGRNVVVQLLTEMDSFDSHNEGVFILGATNQPWDIDPALRRPGRFDRMEVVLPPDREAREVIVAHHLADRPTEGVNPAKIAARSEGYSGADLRLVCEAAAERALSDSLQTGTARPIRAADLDAAVRQVRPSTGPWFEVAKNFASFSNQDGTYDELLAYMRHRRNG